MNAVANKSIKPNIKTTALIPPQGKIQPAGQHFDLTYPQKTLLSSYHQRMQE